MLAVFSFCFTSFSSLWEKITTSAHFLALACESQFTFVRWKPFFVHADCILLCSWCAFHSGLIMWLPADTLVAGWPRRNSLGRLCVTVLLELLPTGNSNCRCLWTGSYLRNHPGIKVNPLSSCLWCCSVQRKSGPWGMIPENSQR